MPVASGQIALGQMKGESQQIGPIADEPFQDFDCLVHAVAVKVRFRLGCTGLHDRLGPPRVGRFRLGSRWNPNQQAAG